MTTIGKAHDKSPALSLLLGYGIVEETCTTKIHLGFLTWRGLYPNGYLGSSKVKLLFKVPSNSSITNGESMMFFKKPPYLFGRNLLLFKPLADLVPILAGSTSLEGTLRRHPLYAAERIAHQPRGGSARRKPLLTFSP